jgi:UDP-glucuronate 4-epimerase
MILITGCAGFIGFHVAQSLLREGWLVLGVDCLSKNYDVRLKQWRLQILQSSKNFFFECGNVSDFGAVLELPKIERVNSCIHLAAHAGVRQSVKDPQRYIAENISGAANILELARLRELANVTIASTSSVYAGHPVPFVETMVPANPLNPYAASKACCEILANNYRSTYGLPISICRFFTVYGSAGRPDMAMFQFIEHVLNGTELTIHGDGEARRDFTHVSDAVSGLIAAHKRTNVGVINIAAGKSVSLMQAINVIEQAAGKKATVKKLPLQSNEMTETFADTSKAKTLLGWVPQMDVTEGIARTVEWHNAHRKALRNLAL